jgi:hypothetical protein
MTRGTRSTVPPKRLLLQIVVQGSAIHGVIIQVDFPPSCPIAAGRRGRMGLLPCDIHIGAALKIQKVRRGEFCMQAVSVGSLARPRHVTTLPQMAHFTHAHTSFVTCPREHRRRFGIELWCWPFLVVAGVVHQPYPENYRPVTHH